VLKGLGNLANIGSMLKQAQEMGSRLQELTEELKAKRVTGSAGGGLVEVEANGAAQVVAVRFDPELFEKHDREMLEDLTTAAVNDALAKAKQLHAEAIQGLAGGLPVPGLEQALANFAGAPIGGGDSDTENQNDPAKGPLEDDDATPPTG